MRLSAGRGAAAAPRRGSRIALPGRQARSIDRAVTEQGGSLYDLDTEGLAELRPDLILTQEQCDVCAVNEATVRRAALGLPGPPRVVSVNPTDLVGVFAVFDDVAALLDARPEAEALRTAFDDLGELIVERVGDRDRPRVVLLEWLDPPFSSGHWNPEIVALAGGAEVLAHAGERSRRVGWAEVAAAEPQVILLSPCGFTLDRAEEELAVLRHRPEWRSLDAVRKGRVALVDGSAYFSRPGPRLKESLAHRRGGDPPERLPATWRPADGFRLPGSPTTVTPTAYNLPKWQIRRDDPSERQTLVTEGFATACRKSRS